jgi:hypothetical protein
MIVPLVLMLFALPARAAAPAVDFDRGAASIGAVLEAGRAAGRLMSEPAAAVFPVLPTGTPRDRERAFQSAFASAVRRLRAPKCAAFYGPGAEEKFRWVAYRFMPLGAPSLGPDGLPRVTGAATFPGSPPAVFINSQGPFLSQILFVPGAGLRTLDMGTGLRGAEFGGLLLLHELGHVVGKFGPDAADSALNRSYTEQVRRRCF